MAVDDDDAGQAEVKGTGEEGRADGQSDKIAVRVVRALFLDSPTNC